MPPHSLGRIYEIIRVLHDGKDAVADDAVSLQERVDVDGFQAFEVAVNHDAVKARVGETGNGTLQRLLSHPVGARELHGSLFRSMTMPPAFVIAVGRASLERAQSQSSDEMAL